MINAQAFCPDYQIGLAHNTMQRLPLLDIPDPNNYTFDEWGVRRVRGDMSVRGDGFPAAVWTWEGVSFDALRALTAFIGQGVYASGLVYIRTRTNQIDSLFKDFSAVMMLPVLTGTDGTVQAQGSNAILPLTIKFVRLIAQ